MKEARRFKMRKSVVDNPDFNTLEENFYWCYTDDNDDLSGPFPSIELAIKDFKETVPFAEEDIGITILKEVKKLVAKYRIDILEKE